MSIWYDLALAVRVLRKRPGFLIPAALTLALGIGANGTVLSFADAMLWRRLPVPDAERLVHVYQTRDGESPQPYPLSFADYLDFRAARSFAALAAHYPTAPLHVVIDGEPVSASGAVVTASYFDVLQLTPSRGRFFSEDEDRVRDRDAVAVISEGFWHRRLGGETEPLGRSLQINGRPFTVIGVAPRGFTGVHPRTSETEVWIPSAMFGVGYRFCDAFARGCAIVELLGRLQPGVSPDASARELDAIARGLAAAFPATHRGTGVRVVSARGTGYGVLPHERQQVSLLVTVTIVILLIACANIAGLLLARATGRRKEMAMRLALGAGRVRLIRQLLAECIVVAAAAGILGLGLAAWGSAILALVFAHDNAGRRVAFELGLTPAVAAAVAVVALASALLFGIWPSFAASRADVIDVLKAETASGGAPRLRLRQALVAAQIALSVALLVGAGLLLRSVRHLGEGPGVDPRPIAVLRLRPSLLQYSRARSQAFQRNVVRRLEAVPGVLHASPSVYMTMMGAGPRVQAAARSVSPVDALLGHGGAAYFSTIGVRLIDGRDFAAADDDAAPRVAIVNQVLAARLWADGRAVGEAIMLDGVSHEVIGVVPDVQYYAAGESPRPQAFVSYWQPHDDDAFLNDSRMFIRVAGDAAAMMPALRRAVTAVDPDVPIGEDYPLVDRVEYAYQPVRLARTVLASFAAVALLLSATGLYGVLAFAVIARRREIGIRVALGADAGRIARLVLREGFAMAGLGVAGGCALAWAGGRMLATLLYGVDPDDPVTFVTTTGVMIAVAAAACALPARQAAAVPPSQALRGE